MIALGKLHDRRTRRGKKIVAESEISHDQKCTFWRVNHVFLSSHFDVVSSNVASTKQRFSIDVKPL